MYIGRAASIPLPGKYQKLNLFFLVNFNLEKND
jgi:hypothetical protein